MNTFIFCGARGADTLWLGVAEQGGHEILTLNKKAPYTQEHYNLTIKANQSLQRTFPTKSDSVNKLLIRNLQAASLAQHIYAIGYLDVTLNICGGTAWSCQGIIDRKDPDCLLYFFDQNRNLWFRFYHCSQQFKEMGCSPPAPSGVWLGIGSREPTLAGKSAIASIWK